MRAAAGDEAPAVARHGFRVAPAVLGELLGVAGLGHRGDDISGHRGKPSFLDGKRYPDGWDGKFNASHAEKQLGALHSGRSIAVDLDMCGDCKGFFAKYAESTGRPQVVTDPEVTRVFLPNRTVIELHQTSDWPAAPFNAPAAAGAGAGSEGLSATQR